MVNVNKIIILCLLFSVPVQAFEIVQLKDVEVEYRKYRHGGYNPLINGYGLQDKEADTYLGISLDTDFFHYFYFNNLVHGTSDRPMSYNGYGQFRTIGWEYHIGLRVTEFLKVEYRHHSQHILDHYGNQPFPVDNSFGFKLTLYESKATHGVIW